MKKQTDAVIPSNYIPIYEVCRVEKIPDAKCKEMSETTMNIIYKMSIEMDFPSIEKFVPYYNTAPNKLISDKEINRFYWHSRTEPFAHLIKAFTGKRVSKGGNIVVMFDFGILRSHYERYKKTGKVTKVENRGRTKKYLLQPGENGRTKLEFPGGGALDIPKNEIYKRLRDGVNAANMLSSDKVTVVEVALAAFANYMELFPDTFNLSPLPINEQAVRKKAGGIYAIRWQDQELAGRVKEFVERYNGANVHPITMNQFVSAAVKAHLERMPVELVEPELAAHLKELEQKKKK